MSPEDDEPQGPRVPPGESPTGDVPPVTDGGDIASPTSWAPPADDVASPDPAPTADLPADPPAAPEAEAYAEPDAYTEPAQAYEAETAARSHEPDAEPYEPDAEPYEPDAEPYEPDAEPYEPDAGAYEADELVAEPFEADAEEPDAVAVPARPPAARRRPPSRSPARRPASARMPARGRPAPRRPAPAARGKGTDASSETPNRRAVVILLSVLTLAVVGLAIWGVSLSRKADEKGAPPASTAPTTTLATLPDEAFVTFRDPETNFTMRYPRGWVRTEAPNREIRLQVTDGRQFAVRVQVRRTEVATTPANVGNLEPVMSGLIVGDSRVLSRDPVTINGLIGFRYIYTFLDEAGLEEAHVHYFLFQGHKLNSIVFAAPSSEFGRIEGVFDQMVNSFRSEPEPETTTTPPTTTG